MINQRWLGAIALIATVLSGCSTGLEEYQQITMDVQLPQAEDAKGPNELNYLAETEAVIARRLDGFGVESAEVNSTQEPEQIVVRLPLSVDLDVAEEVLTRRGQLYLRNEKPDTEGDLAAEIENLQRLLVEQNTLFQTGEQAAAAALRPKVEQSRNAIASFFEPSELTGERLQSAEAVREEGDIWAVKIQFDEVGAEMFAEQTKEMAGTGRAIGLFLDNILLSTPVVDVSFVETGITGGEALISGNFTEEGAKDLEIQLDSGALPVYLKTVEVTSTAERVEGDENGDSSEEADREENAE